MRKTMISALMIMMLLLPGCGGSKEKRLEYACERLVTAESFSVTAAVQVDFGTVLEEYTLEYAYDGTQWMVLVTEPALAAGVTARIDADTSELEYDGAILTTGNLLKNGVTPIGAVPLVYEALHTGIPECVWEEGTMLAGTFVYDDAVSVTVWFAENGNPVAAELAENGIVKAVCRLTNLQIKEAIYESKDETDMGGDPSGESGT